MKNLESTLKAARNLIAQYPSQDISYGDAHRILEMADNCPSWAVMLGYLIGFAQGYKAARKGGQAK